MFVFNCLNVFVCVVFFENMIQIFEFFLEIHLFDVGL